MKPHIRSLKTGVQVWALVEECLEGNEVVINYNGDLIRVVNESSKIFRVGERVQLRVMAVQPLEFKILTLGSRFVRPISIDLNV